MMMRLVSRFSNPSTEGLQTKAMAKICEDRFKQYSKIRKPEEQRRRWVAAAVEVGEKWMEKFGNRNNEDIVFVGLKTKRY